MNSVQQITKQSRQAREWMEREKKNGERIIWRISGIFIYIYASGNKKKKFGAESVNEIFYYYLCVQWHKRIV